MQPSIWLGLQLGIDFLYRFLTGIGFAEDAQAY